MTKNCPNCGEVMIYVEHKIDDNFGVSGCPIVTSSSASAIPDPENYWECQKCGEIIFE